MIMMVLETLIALSFLGNGLEDLREEAQKRADVFVIEAEAGLPEFLMIAEITTESSPDAPLLFRSKSRMEMLRLSGIQAERFICSPSVLADDRENPFKKSGATPQKPSFARVENWKRIHFDGKSYDLLDLYGQPQEPVFIRPDDRFASLGFTTCLTPWDWVLLRPGVIDRNAKDLPKQIFSEKKKCLSAKQLKGEDLFSLWAIPSNDVRVVNTTVFSEFLIKNYSVHYFRQPIDLENVELSQAVQIGSTETTWGKCGTTPVPKTVVSKIRETPKSELMTYVIDLKVYSVDDKPFEEYKRDMIKIRESIKSKE